MIVLGIIGINKHNSSIKNGALICNIVTKFSSYMNETFYFS